jgi:TPP-dependent trihydroxycyclohexane-1,2-dione (THcHDO) dehydratase
MAGLGVAVGVGVSVGGSGVNVLVGGKVAVDVGEADVAVGDGGTMTAQPARSTAISAARRIRLKFIDKAGFTMSPRRFSG